MTRRGVAVRGSQRKKQTKSSASLKSTSKVKTTKIKGTSVTRSEKGQTSLLAFTRNLRKSKPDKGESEVDEPSDETTGEERFSEHPTTQKNDRSKLHKKPKKDKNQSQNQRFTIEKEAEIPKSKTKLQKKGIFLKFPFIIFFFL